MISSWRRLRAARRAAKKRGLEEDIIGSMELTIPSHFRCPISLDLMKDPVTLSTGITYDRDSIETWIEAGNITCPVTNKVLRNLEPIPNHAIRKIIQDWCVEKKSYGVERIPTPRIPISSHEVLEILSRIEAATQRNDEEYCRELVSKIKASAKESDRNRRCIVLNGASRVLSAAFEALSNTDSIDKHVALLEEILSTLTLVMSLSSLDEDTKGNLSTVQSLRSIVWFLRFGSLSGQRNAVLALKTILSCNQAKVEDVVKIEGVLESLVKLIKEPICPTTTKASLLSMFYIISNQKVIVTRFLEMGLAEILLEILVDSERSICEKALGVLDGICSHSEGRNKAYENALTMPLLVKKLLRVSDLATEFSVSILWTLVKNDEDKQGSVILEALQVGAFQKLLLLLQVGCNETTKEKVTDLLKFMNLYRNSAECIDSLDFKNLKRPF